MSNNTALGRTVLRTNSSERVLIVDDDPGTRLIIRAALERDGYEFFEAEDGLSALAQFQKHRPDIILMDALMPRMDGFEATSRIRQAELRSKAPILIVTSLEEEDAVDRAFQAGANDFIPKPVHVRVLRHRVRRLLDGYIAASDLTRLAYHDPLTGLANRARFADRLGSAMSQAKRNGNRISLLLLDLDNFKIFNDTLGHEIGDQLLLAVSERIARSVREADSVARMGGDEFALVFEGPGTHMRTGLIAERVLTAIREPIDLPGHQVIVTASIGISIFPSDGADISTLTKFADTAMYQAKASGGNTSRYYDTKMSIAATKRLTLESRLRQAIERQELLTYYQPQVEMSSGALTGFEALIRWQHPELGLVPPNEFVPLAEEIGLIISIGEWVLRQACLQCRRWHNEGHGPLQMGVNLSARQLADEHFVERVGEILAATGMAPGNLELELTESCLVRNDPATRETLLGLRALGVGLSIDDFGTAYSSLSYLKRFPITSLKIDRSFVSGLPKDAHDAAIIEALLVLARGFGLNVVAEGIETEEQFEYLRELGCHTGQGYLIGRPQPPEEFQRPTAVLAAAALRATN